MFLLIGTVEIETGDVRDQSHQYSAYQICLADLPKIVAKSRLEVMTIGQNAQITLVEIENHSGNENSAEDNTGKHQHNPNHFSSRHRISLLVEKEGNLAVSLLNDELTLQRLLNSNSHGNSHTDHGVVTCLGSRSNRTENVQVA